MITLTVLLYGNSYSANESFRSVNTGNWHTNGTWEMSTNNGISWFPATSTPRDSSGLITIQSPNTVTVTISVSADQLTVNTGATLSVNTGIILTIVNGGSNDLTLQTGSVLSGAGTLQSQGNGTVIVVSASSTFNTPFNVNSGSVMVSDNQPPLIARLRGAITVDNGATLTAGNGGVTLEAYGTVVNNGLINGFSGAILSIKGPSLTNAGSITSPGLNFDTATVLSGAGIISSSLITINGNGNVSLLSDILFTPASFFTMNAGAVLNPNGQIFSLASGQFVLNTGASVTNSGTFKTQGTVQLNLKAGSNFAAPLLVASGTTTANSSTIPLVGKLFGPLTINNGAILFTGNGGFNLEAYGNVVNNGTISGSSGAAFTLKGPSLINNGAITSAKLAFDSASVISGAGTFTGAAISLDSSSNVSLGSNVTFSPGGTFTINSGSTLNPGSNIFTMSSGSMLLSGGTIQNSGTFRTQGSVNLNVKQGSFFNAPLNVNTGTTTVTNTTSPLLSRFFGTLTIDNGATLNTGNGGYEMEVYNNVINNGIITGTSGSAFTLMGASFINNGSLSPPAFNFDTVSTISGAGIFSAAVNVMSSSGNITLGSNITFSPSSFTINGILNLNSNIFTLTSGSFTAASGSSVLSSGTFKTQGSVSVSAKNGSSFNPPLNIASGTATVNDLTAPLTSKINGVITIDAGAAMNIGNGNYILEANNNVINNGTITGGSGATFRMFGANLTNNGSITNPVFQFQSGLHTLQGTGSWTIAAVLMSGANVSLASNHQLFGVNINSGATFNISNFTLKLNSSNPITQNGTFTIANSNVEYNGSAVQVISTTNVSYDGLRINNTSGALLNANVNVNDTLAVILGDLNLNGRIITVSPTGYLTETPGNTVKGSTGYIVTTRNIGTPNALNVGGFGAILTSNTNLGSTEIKRGHTIQFGLNGGSSIQRYYDISPANNRPQCYFGL